MTTDTHTNDIFTGKVVELTDDKIVLAIPGTDYQIHLVPDTSVEQIDAEVGKRIKGRIEATALRIHPAAGGGRFIEPVWGHPRIVAGTVRSIDAQSGRMLVDVAVPMWVTAPPEQDFTVIAPDQLVNFYIESGARFQPLQDD